MRIRDPGLAIMGIIGLASFTLLCVVSYVIASKVETLTIHVTGKERLMAVSTDSDGRTSTRYTSMVYAKEDVFTVSDSLWHGHFSAMSVYGRITEGSTCNVTAVGYRVGFLSMSRNIIEAECKQ